MRSSQKIDRNDVEGVNRIWRESGYVLREFARRWPCAVSTASAALHDLQDEGLLEHPISPPRFNKGLGPRTPRARHQNLDEVDLPEAIYALLKPRQDGATYEELADTLDVAPRRVKEAVVELEKRGKYVARSGKVVSAYIMPGVEERVTIDVEPKDTYYIGVLGDTHFGSLLQQPTLLNAFMERAMERFELDCWIHCGDATDGQGVYKGHAQELWLNGADDQADYFIEAYPETGVPTNIISGNHDYSHIARGGADVLRRITDSRPDITALGHRGAYVNIGGVAAYIWHPTGGSSYAKSYKVQKRVEAFSDTDKPHFLLTGHLHQWVHVWHRNIHAFLIPSWQKTSVFIRSLGYESMIGGMVLEVGLDDAGDPIEVTPHLTKYDPLDKDYPRWS